MKNVSRNRFLLCFRPAVDMEIVLESKSVVDRSASQGFPYVSVENKEETKTPKRTFSRVLKAVMFEAILIKRAGDRKGCPQDSCQSSRSLSMNSGRSHDASDDKSGNRASVDTYMDREVRTNSALSHSSSSGSSYSGSISEKKKSPRSLSDKTKQDSRNHQDLVEKPKKVDMGCSSFNSGIYLLVISLIITILWGRLYAILFTSIWLYFVPRRHVGYGRQESVIKLAKTESREYRKKVVIEGLLERNHHRRH